MTEADRVEVPYEAEARGWAAFAAGLRGYYAPHEYAEVLRVAAPVWGVAMEAAAPVIAAEAVRAGRIAELEHWVEYHEQQANLPGMDYDVRKIHVAQSNRLRRRIAELKREDGHG